MHKGAFYVLFHGNFLCWGNFFVSDALSTDCARSHHTKASFVQKEVARRSRDGGIVCVFADLETLQNDRLDNPSVAARQLLLHKGAFYVLFHGNFLCARGSFLYFMLYRRS